MAKKPAINVTTTALELADVQRALRELEAKAAVLKEALKGALQDGEHQAGSVTLVLYSGTRETLDRAALERELGEEVVGRFVRVSEFRCLRFK